MFQHPNLDMSTKSGQEGVQLKESSRYGEDQLGVYAGGEQRVFC